MPHPFAREIAENLRLWDAWTTVHTTSAFYDVQRFRDDPTDVRIEDWEREEVGDVAGKTPAPRAVSLRARRALVGARCEPRAARPHRRLEAVATLDAAGVPVAVMIGPVIPGLNDEEIPRILEAAKGAGAFTASRVLHRLSPPLDAIFARWLDEIYRRRRAAC